MSSQSRVVVSGPLSVYASGFGEELARRGYRSGAVKQLQLMAHVSRWLAACCLEAGDLTTVRIDEFVTERRASGPAHLVSARALSPLLEYLRSLGVVPLAEAPVPLTAADRLVQRYSVYLLEQRGIATASVRNYAGVARVFFAERERVRGELALHELDGAAVSEFVLRESVRCSVGSAKCMITRLRVLLRFLQVEGEIDRDLTGAVPRVASWRLASLVKAMDAQDVVRLLEGCDRGSSLGRRDFAVLLLLSRLGLRAAEVAAIQLADIDWRSGQLLVRGKGSREELLPLPADVGEALANWLRFGRPRCETRLVFTRARAPREGLQAISVTAIVNRACKRAGLPLVGAHRLRHTAATELLRAGASLADVGQVLRHRDPDTTSIYAKVDRLALAALITPWPGAAK